MQIILPEKKVESVERVVGQSEAAHWTLGSTTPGACCGIFCIL